MRAAANGQADCLRLLIDAGADKEAKDWVRRRLLLVCLFASYFPSACFLFTATVPPIFSSTAICLALYYSLRSRDLLGAIFSL